jgi:Na+:H+ antiporter, NhaA family
MARPRSALRDFLESEAFGGVLLMIAAATALIAANLPATATAYAYFVHLELGPVPLHLIVNDGLMALFFLLVGLEIKRELLDGQLSHPADRRLPIIAAASGMALRAAGRSLPRPTSPSPLGSSPCSASGHLPR